MWRYETLLDFSYFLWLFMSGSYLPDLYFEPPSSWTDAPLFVARSDNPDKQNNNLNVLHLVSPPDQRKLKSN